MDRKFEQFEQLQSTMQKSANQSMEEEMIYRVPSSQKMTLHVSSAPSMIHSDEATTQR